MAQPPPKRRKRNVDQTSDDEDDDDAYNPDHTPGHTPGHTQTNTLNNYLVPSPERPRPTSATTNLSRHTTESPPPSLPARITRQTVKPSFKPLQPQNPNSSKSTKSTSTSPEKSRARSIPSRSKQSEKGRTADIASLFSKQAERAPKIPRSTRTTVDDISSDPISVSDDDEVGEHTAAITSRVGQNAQNAQRRFRDTPQSTVTASAPASQRFLRPPRPAPDISTTSDQRPWSERFGPTSLSELAVHNRKVADVRRWLEDVMAGRLRQRLLILKGPAGSGKTTTLRLLAKDLKCELLEWRNPTGSLGATQGFQSASAQFDEFMGRGGKFGQLDLDDEENPPPPSNANGKVHDDTRKIIVIEEFPNTFARSSTALTSFRNTILEFLATNTPSLAGFGHQAAQDPITPIVMIISETLLTTTSASADSFTAHRLLGPEIIRHPGTGIIEFNPVAPTILATALELIVQKEARKSGRKRTPGPLVLKQLGGIGDIRSAISSLEFLCLKGDSDTNWGSRVTFTKPKRGGKTSVALTKSESESLELISQREATLGIFHAVGKIVYNKREETPMDTGTPEGRAEMLPDYLANCSRPRRSEVNVDGLIDETGTDTSTFISALHENYALSCDPTGPSDPNSAVDYINGCIEYLSDSDLLCPSWDIFFGGRTSGASGFSSGDSASHTLRQDEIIFQVATRGLLFSLPCPVKRVKTAHGRAGGDAYRLFYPTSLKLWRDKEELEGLVDHLATTLLKGGTTTGHNVTEGASAFAFRRPKPTNNSDNGNEGGDWISKRAHAPKQKKPGQDQNETETETAPPLLSLGSVARREMLLERLPYMALMARAAGKKGPGSLLGGVRAKDIERVVSFTGIDGPAADEEDAEADDGGAEEWATDRPTEEPSSPRKRQAPAGIRHRRASGASTGLITAELPVQKLVLSDDDIED